ncbi:MAG: DUF1850 domain-containing protein [Pseudomonadota bacterium]
MSRRGAVKIGGAGLLVLLLAGWYLRAPVLRLEVQGEDGRPLLSLAASPGQEFSLWFLHSYDRAFFQEHYRLEAGGRILLTHMTFKSSLNGEGFELGSYRALPGGVGELADINQELERVQFMLGSPDLANHTLIVDGRRWRLLDYAHTGDLLSLRGVNRPRWRVWWPERG